MVNPFTEYKGNNENSVVFMRKTSHVLRSACEKPLKAITPVIATVMLMLITVGVVGVTYTWFSNMMTTQTEKNIAIPVGGIQCINNRISAIVTNAGANSNITDDDIVVADVNGVSVRNTPFFGGFNTNGLVGYWRFEDIVNGKARDYSTYKNDGIVTGATPTPNGKFGSAYSFNGANDFVIHPEIMLYTNQPWTLSMWQFKPSGSDPSWQAFAGEHLGNDGSDKSRGYFMWHGGDLTLYKHYNPATVYSWSDLTLGGEVPYDQWFNLVVTSVPYSPTEVTLTPYLNGKAASSKTIPSSSFRFEYIGGNEERYFNGAIDEVQIWNRALTPDEITQLNKTNAGNFTMAPNKAVTLIKGYPVSAKGKYTVRVGTRNGVIERTVECL